MSSLDGAIDRVRDTITRKWPPPSIEDLATLVGAIDALRAEVARLTRERDEARAEAHRLFKIVMERDTWIVERDATIARLREVLTAARDHIARWSTHSEGGELFDKITAALASAPAAIATLHILACPKCGSTELRRDATARAQNGEWVLVPGEELDLGPFVWCAACDEEFQPGEIDEIPSPPAKKDAPAAVEPPADPYLEKVRQMGIANDRLIAEMADEFAESVHASKKDASHE